MLSTDIYMIILEIIFLGKKTWFCLIKFNTRFLNMFCEIFSKIFLLSSRKISAAADEYFFCLLGRYLLRRMRRVRAEVRMVELVKEADLVKRRCQHQVIWQHLEQLSGQIWIRFLIHFI